MCVATYTNRYDSQEAASPQSSPKGAPLSSIQHRYSVGSSKMVSPFFSAPTQHSATSYPFNHRDTLFEPDVLSFQPQTPKVKLGWRPKAVTFVSSWINIIKATLCVEGHAAGNCVYTRTVQKGMCEEEPKTLCIIVATSHPKDARDVTCKSRIKVWTFSCETGNSFWRSCLRKLGQTSKRKRIRTTVRLVPSPVTHLLKKTVEKQIGGVNLMWHYIGKFLWSGIRREEWLGPHCFIKRCCSGISMALLRGSCCCRTQRTESGSPAQEPAWNIKLAFWA